jgi:hypothetical protein
MTTTALFVVGLGCATQEWEIGSAQRSALIEAYRIQDEAIRRSDAPTFLATLAPDYEVHLRNGVKLSRAQVATAITNDMARTRSVESAKSDLDVIDIRGDTAVVTVKHQTIRTVEDAAGQPRRWESGVVHKETWIRMRDGWRIRRLEEKEQLYLRRDGVAL